MSTDLTPAQTRVLDAIRSHMAQHGDAPTHSEIAAVMGYSSANAAKDHLLALRRKGYIQLSPGVHRGIRLTSMITEQISMLDVMADPTRPSRSVLSLKR